MTAKDTHYSKPHSVQVEAMAGYSIAPSDIAQVLGIDVERLKADYPSQLDGGQIKANARVAESLYRKATGEGREAVTAAIFWLKTRARWKETSVQEYAAQLSFIRSTRKHRRPWKGQEPRGRSIGQSRIFVEIKCLDLLVEAL
ncbi:hypothetical protein [Mesorhizobium temperatum]|uniref:Uncharacterized protein n=1 Tax=Mesorhizobium temperatum TaxID=241416 RepID=A0A271LNR6_9HYPH|nr:hypothetical protein [Mesorhizobium temperatum]PAQ09802.1 hypothetical protein CIT26_11015 [Mesorhizobium temperatum]